MPIRFHSEATGDVVMLDDIGHRFIHMLGHSGTVPGAIAAEDVPAALDRLRAALDKAARAAGKTGKGSGEDEDGEPRIGLQVRAVPLIDMMERIIAARSWLAWE